MLTVTDLVAIAEELAPEESKAYFSHTLKGMVADKSWRVRYMIADNFVKASAMGTTHNGYRCDLAVARKTAQNN